jgi:hypothetical protein
MRRGLPAVALGLALPALPLAAHHSHSAIYFLDRESVLHGKIVTILLRNPHSMLVMEAPDEAGQMLHWSVEWGAAGQLGEWGIKRDTLQAGDEIELTIFPGREAESHRGLVKILRRPSDGFEWGAKPGETVKNWGIR